MGPGAKPLTSHLPFCSSAPLLHAGVIGEHADLVAEAGLEGWDGDLEDQGTLVSRGIGTVPFDPV